jgi:hypothetical protein
MRRFPGGICVLAAFLFFFAAPFKLMASSDPTLLSLVPPGAQVVAGMDSPPPKGRPGSFVLISHNNTIDLDDFYALTGADSSRVVRHAIFVAIADDTGYLREHGLMLSGHFDRERVYKSAEDGGAPVISYRGIPVLEIQPLARERGSYGEVRWLAVLDSNVLLFGTITTVQEELDRRVTGSTTDPILVSKLARLHSDDETWCILSTRLLNDQIQKALAAIDPHVADLAVGGDAFEFGVRNRKQVELEYEVTTTSGAGTHVISGSLLQSLTGPGKGSSLLPSMDTTGTGGDKTVRGVIKIPTALFSRWLSDVNARQGSTLP